MKWFDSSIVKQYLMINYFEFYHTIPTLTRSLPNDKILHWSIFKTVDEKMHVAEMMISLSDRVENIVGIGENAGYQLLYVFKRLLFQGR